MNIYNTATMPTLPVIPKSRQPLRLSETQSISPFRVKAMQAEYRRLLQETRQPTESDLVKALRALFMKTIEFYNAQPRIPMNSQVTRTLTMIQQGLHAQHASTKRAAILAIPILGACPAAEKDQRVASALKAVQRALEGKGAQ